MQNEVSLDLGWGKMLGTAMAKYADVDFTIMEVAFKGSPYLCPKCAHSYKRLGWLRRHLLKKE